MSTPSLKRAALRCADIGSPIISAALALAVLAIGLGGCAQEGTVSGSVSPRADQDVTLIIHVTPARAMVESGHMFGATGEPRPYTYVVESKNGHRTCGITFPWRIFDRTPEALAWWQWEVDGNCLHRNADWRE